MPQQTQHVLLYILLMWTTFVSITQIVLLSLFFTAGQRGLCPECGTAGVPDKLRGMTTPPNPSYDGLFLGKGMMLTFKGRGYTGLPNQTEIEWIAANPSEKLITGSKGNLKILLDGYFFLTLQVTLCEKSQKNETVELTFNQDVKLKGWIHQNTVSTGVLSRAIELSAGGLLKVTISSGGLCINFNESLTHLDIIFITKV
ncbi:uncharacterized protein LOC112146642 isoform X2 [Oryzias melastigma]|uniref:uncharacterized protein LOC112146642 isoform X2 n=1 Tax=Oryzias melastigma TaxID=30732 RepID=UPI000CF83730|nr:uncharacterized protein LOC112146642 isoform X2 [Oryzias melastigma]